ncbi:MAG: type II secretion system F family protein [Deltaproteobacteria bacterium]|nr:type II secretion system F family protein [Deltaproteobacteria bacterium]MBN2672273.1 type II secretion system F family protein [Deltaproteobacteria bacterium]
MTLALSCLTAVSVLFLANGIEKSSRFKGYWKRYEQLFLFSIRQNRNTAKNAATGTIVLCFVTGMLSLYLNAPKPAFATVGLFFLPWLLHRHVEKVRKAQLNRQMDSMLANLANAVSVTGNLVNAIEDVAAGEPEPMRSALQLTLHEINLGKSETDALKHFADRSGIPLLATAIGAVIVGKQQGGNLGAILSSTAEGIREIKRLEGVLKVKTAEGRNQAWVMGTVPIFLCGILQIINPTWLAPLWSTPLGWVIVAACILLEGIAIFLIRKILAVTL